MNSLLMPRLFTLGVVRSILFVLQMQQENRESLDERRRFPYGEKFS